jgi:hypothetical protein
MSYAGEDNQAEQEPAVRCDCARAEGCQHGNWSKWAAEAEREIENDEPVDPEVEAKMRDNAAG